MVFWIYLVKGSLFVVCACVSVVLYLYELCSYWNEVKQQRCKPSVLASTSVTFSTIARVLSL